jgi:hypothetical protein
MILTMRLKSETTIFFLQNECDGLSSVSVPGLVITLPRNCPVGGCLIFLLTLQVCAFSQMGFLYCALAPFHISLKGKVFTATISLVSHNHGISRSLGVATTRCRFDFLAVATSCKILEC